MKSLTFYKYGFFLTTQLKWLLVTNRFLSIWRVRNWWFDFESPNQRLEKVGKLKLLASPTGENNSVTILQDVRLYALQFAPGQGTFQYQIKDGRAAYIHIVSGKFQ